MSEKPYQSKERQVAAFSSHQLAQLTPCLQAVK